MRCICPFVWSTLHWYSSSELLSQWPRLEQQILSYVTFACMCELSIETHFDGQHTKLKKSTNNALENITKGFNEIHIHTRVERNKKMLNANILSILRGKTTWLCTWKMEMSDARRLWFYYFSVVFFFWMHLKSGHDDESKYSRNSVNGCRISERDKFIVVLYCKNIKHTWIELIKTRVSSDKKSQTN